jgi:hypothetical protein
MVYGDITGRDGGYEGSGSEELHLLSEEARELVLT